MQFIDANGTPCTLETSFSISVIVPSLMPGVMERYAQQMQFPQWMDGVMPM
jgi:hypothetical protein